MSEPIFVNAAPSNVPFRHVSIPGILSTEDARRALHWLREEAPWKLRVEDFYEQHEFSLLNADLGEEILFLIEKSFIEQIRGAMREYFGLRALPTLIDINAHRLTAQQAIRVHNDYIEGEETHRLLMQLNDGWTLDKGGVLMLFSGPETFHSAILPRHADGFAFAISPNSYHAVSQIKHGERFTVVYSFRSHP
jgi:hypothetical protein